MTNLIIKMKTSLITILNDEIRKAGYISYDEMLAICRSNNYKGETGRRRLENDESPIIKHVMATKESGGQYVSGYKWIEGSAPRKIETETTVGLSQMALRDIVQ